MIKKLIIFMMVVLCVLGLAACHNTDDPTETTKLPDDVVVVEPVAPSVKVTVALWDTTHITTATEDYYNYCIEVSSDEMYGTPDTAIIYFSSDDGMKPLKEVFPDITIDTYCPNKLLGGSTEYFIVVKSPKMLDTKKIKVCVDGSTAYKEGMSWTNKEDFVSKYGKDLYYNITATLKSVVKYNSNVFIQPNHIGSDLYLLTNGDDSVLYSYDSNPEAQIVDGKVKKALNIKALNSSTIEDFFGKEYELVFLSVEDNAATNSDIIGKLSRDNLTIKTEFEDQTWYLIIEKNDGQITDLKDIPQYVAFNFFVEEWTETLKSELRESTVVFKLW